MIREWKAFLAEEDGMGVVEVILIIVVLISLVTVFKYQISSLVNTILDKITKNAKKDYSLNQGTRGQHHAVFSSDADPCPLVLFFSVGGGKGTKPFGYGRASAVAGFRICFWRISYGFMAGLPPAVSGRE